MKIENMIPIEFDLTDFRALQQRYLDGTLLPDELVRQVSARIDASDRTTAGDIARGFGRSASPELRARRNSPPIHDHAAPDCARQRGWPREQASPKQPPPQLRPAAARI